MALIHYVLISSCQLCHRVLRLRCDDMWQFERAWSFEDHNDPQTLPQRALSKTWRPVAIGQVLRRLVVLDHNSPYHTAFEADENEDQKMQLYILC